MTKDLYIIKEKYGEEMAHYCRENFSSILETEGLLSSLLFEHFVPSHELYHDLESNHLLPNFDQYIYNFTKEKKALIEVTQTPKELLESVGYDLYECKTEEDIQKFKKYYTPKEELCTFRGGLNMVFFVFFAVKKNVEEIKRENFPDEYGTSVICIQFEKIINQVSIKNRYNSAFSNNLENIVEGLTKSFENAYGFHIKTVSDFKIPNYVNYNDKYYKYNYEINNNYYGTDNVFIQKANIFIEKDQAFFYEKERYILFDYYLLDLKEKKISCLDEMIEDSFIDTIGNIQKIEIEKENDNKKIKIINDVGYTIEIIINKNNQMISYQNNEVTKIKNDFCYFNETLEDFSASKLEEVGDNFLYSNVSLKNVYSPNLKVIGNGFLQFNSFLEEVSFPNVTTIGDGFCFENKIIKKVYLPKVKTIRHNFCSNSKALTLLYLPSVETIGDYFFSNSKALTFLYLPSAKTIGNYFCESNKNLEEFFLPNVETIGDQFLKFNESLKVFESPNLRMIGNSFCESNNSLEVLNLPNVETIGNNFLKDNKCLKVLESPNLRVIGHNFCESNNSLEVLNLPNVESIGFSCLNNNFGLKKIYLPKVKEIGDDFCYSAVDLRELILPNVEYIGEYFFYKNNHLKVFVAPQLKKIGKTMKRQCLSEERSFLYKKLPLKILVLNDEWMKEDYPLILTYKKKLLLKEKMNQIVRILQLK